MSQILCETAVLVELSGSKLCRILNVGLWWPKTSILKVFQRSRSRIGPRNGPGRRRHLRPVPIILQTHSRLRLSKVQTYPSTIRPLSRSTNSGQGRPGQTGSPQRPASTAGQTLPQRRQRFQWSPCQPPTKGMWETPCGRPWLN